MSEFLNTLTRGWNIVRTIRVLFGLSAIVYSIQSHDPILALAGVALLLMGVLNLGCAGGACVLPKTGKPVAKNSSVQNGSNIPTDLN